MKNANEEAIKELMTIGDFVRWGVSRFLEADIYYGHGTDNAWDEAITLVLKALHLPHDFNTSFMQARLIHSEKLTIIQYIQQRVTQRIPAAYLTHEAWFAGLKFYVDNRVIIPRSPLAEMIEHGFEPWISEPPEAILDLCTGSGCIAIACAKTFADTRVDAVDISRDALAVAKINVEQYQLQDQVELIESNLFEKLTYRKYDIIISNPPYVDAQDMDELPQEYLHEPTLALAAGDDGLDIVRQILKQALDHLTEQGILIVEVGNSEQALISQYPRIPFTWLEFAKGGNGVFLLTAAQLEEYADVFAEDH